MWEFKERLLKYPAYLHVSRDDWYIQEYYPGPDYRYRGTFLRINSNEVELYISHLQLSWAKFIELRSSLSDEKELTLSGSGSLKIFINSFRGSGISLSGTNGFISNEDTLIAYVEELKTLETRARAVQILLKGV